MTTGQRITQKRKEAELSQEALGAELGVSRQSIYKWESDAALPEIDKLVTLSRRFGVTVGWLLGVEESPEAEVPADDSELTDRQLNMVEEIVDRYLSAQPKPKKRRRWPQVLAVLVLLCVAVNLFNRLDQLNHQYQNLTYAVSSVERSVDHQINGISNRVEEILKQQNDLTAEYGTELINISYGGSGQGSAVFSAYAVPKTYVEGMTVEFRVQEHGPTGGANVVPVEAGPGRRFSTEAISCELTDEITLSAVFLYPDGSQATQVLDTYTGLYAVSLPRVSIQDYSLFGRELSDGALTLKDEYVTVSTDPGDVQGSDPAAKAAEIRLGIFRNQTLVAWAEPCDQPSSFHGSFTGEQFYKLPDVTLPMLSSSEQVQIAALVTDTYGRQFMACDIPFVISDSRGDIPYLTYPADGTYDPDPAHWNF